MTTRPFDPTGNGGEPPEWLARLARLGQPGGADVGEAIMRLRQTAGSPEQTLALQALLGALGPEPAFEPVRVACAGLLVERGDASQALAVLGPCRSIEGMMLAADLYASTGQLPRALSTVERVLARSIDAPGARERHAEWSAQLGRAARPVAPLTDTGATVVGPSRASTPFRLLREAARGGAGTVYEAEDELLGRRLAFKVYHQPERDREQLLSEGRTAVRLEGPGIVRVFDVSPDDGWLALEWLARGSLRDALRLGTVELLVPLQPWLRALAAALARVHRAGLVHGDLKPGNVLFRAPGDPVLGDFGLCRPRGEPNRGGTPGYLSPERLAGSPADPRDDTYAYGRILEDTLSGLESLPSSAGARGSAPRPATAVDHARLAAVARACLARADDRPPDGQALVAWLDG